MCIFICVNPKVRERLEMPLARSQRESMQMCGLCPSESQLLPPLPGVAPMKATIKRLDEASVRRITKRSAWLQAYWRSRTRAPSRGVSAKDWHNAFDAIAEAWGRLLSLVGLRW